MLNISIVRFQWLFTLLLVAALAAGIGLLYAVANYEWQASLIVVPAIGVAALLLLPRMSRLDTGTFLLRILIAGLLLRLAFSMVALWVGFGVYGGTADASGYHRNGTIIAEQIRRLEFGDLFNSVQWGTQFVNFFTGVIYSLIGPSLFGGYLVYALLAFLGSYYFYKAFRTALPQGNKQLYAVLVFFSPSILFWSNGISKDALIFLFLGLVAYGSAQLTRARLQGLVPLCLGLLGTGLIRPHIAAILTIALVVAFLVRGKGKKAVHPAIFALVMLAVIGLAWFFLPRVAAYVGISELSQEATLNLLRTLPGNSNEGDSPTFQVMDITNPLAFPVAMITILIRPFPWESHNLMALVQSAEGIVMGGLILWRIKSLGKAIASAFSNTYLRYILLYMIAFIFAFSMIANFGIIARERTMLMPFFFMLIAYVPSQARIGDGKQQVVV